MYKKNLKENKVPDRKMSIFKSSKAKRWERRLRLAPVSYTAFLAVTSAAPFPA